MFFVMFEVTKIHLITVKVRRSVGFVYKTDGLS